MTGQSIAAVRIHDARLRWPVEPELEARLTGRVIGRIERRGKYLLLECLPADARPDADGDDAAPGWLLVHLGMTGTLRVYPDAPAAGEPSGPEIRPPTAEVVFCARAGAPASATDRASASLVSWIRF